MNKDLAPGELRVLVAVADSRGFSAAAGVLGLTQSAVSHADGRGGTRVGVAASTGRDVSAVGIVRPMVEAVLGAGNG